MTREEQEHRTDSGIHLISAITLATTDMARSMRFYQTLGFEFYHGGEQSSFTSFRAGSSYLNLIATSAGQSPTSWGRVIFYVADVDALYEHAIAQGLRPETSPRDASWGERYFHINDPDGHEISFAKPL